MQRPFNTLVRFLLVFCLRVPMPAQHTAFPVIDMHVHGTNTTPDAITTRFSQGGLRTVFLAGLASDITKWNEAIDSDRLFPGLTFPCPSGQHIHTGRECFPGGRDFPNPIWLRQEIQSKRIRAFGEISLQYMGMRPDDAQMEPYWKMAEEFDLPVGIHMGSGPPGIAFEAKLTALTAPQYRMSTGDPLLLEEVLLRHKKLRLFVMHAGWPRFESTIALLSMYPNVYVDISALSDPRVLPRVSYLKYLRELVENGFGKRIMFGSDFPREAERGVTVVMEAEFMTTEQKSDILCGNAARFLKLDSSVCAGQPPPSK